MDMKCVPQAEYYNSAVRMLVVSSSAAIFSV